MVQSESKFIQEISTLSTTDFDSFLKHFSQFLNLQISKDINQVLKFCGFYLKSWESLDKEHTEELNLNLPKEAISDKTVRHRPAVSDTHKEIQRLQKTQTSDDEPLIKKEESELPSVTQLGRTLTQWSYRIKSRVASYQKKTKSESGLPQL